MTTMKIGQLAKEAEVNIETIRYYERRGLIPKPPRRPSGYRVYSQDSVTRIRFIKGAQDLGFSLAEIERLLALRVDAGTNCEDVRRQAQAKLDEISDKILALQRLQGALAELVTACELDGPQGECPILEAVEHQAQRVSEQCPVNS